MATSMLTQGSYSSPLHVRAPHLSRGSFLFGPWRQVQLRTPTLNTLLCFLCYLFLYGAEKSMVILGHALFSWPPLDPNPPREI